MDDNLSGMDDTTRAIIERITVQFNKPTCIRSGHSCMVYYDCIQLTPSDLARLAAQATGHLEEHTFDMVVGIAYYGVLFAAAVAGGRQVVILQTDGKLCGPSIKGKRVLLVDDVVYSGSGMRRAAEVVEASGGTVAGYVCIVDRSEGRPALDKPLWSAYRTSMV